MELMQAHTQWATRPADERFTSLPEMLSAQIAIRDRSEARALSTRRITAMPIEGDDTFKGLQLVGPKMSDEPVTASHHAFSQLCGLGKAPGGYLRQLPSPIVADCLNYGLKITREIDDIGVLVRNPEGGAAEPAALMAATGPNYGRVWNCNVIERVIQTFGDGVTGHFRVPGEWGRKVAVTKDNTTLYAGDRNMFVFLCDEENRIEVPNRRNGLMGSMARGFFIWNSEVGDKSLGMASFLFDYVCGNRIVWGAIDYEELRIRHTISAPDKFIERMAPAIEAFDKSSTKGLKDALAAAQESKIDDVQKFLHKRFGQNTVAAIIATHMAEEDRPIETVWDAVTGITAYAKGIPNQDRRVEFERKAGALLTAARA